jgi:hypothetical protein
MSHQIRSGSRKRGNVEPPPSHSSPPTPAELMRTLVGTQHASAKNMCDMINDDNSSVHQGPDYNRTIQIIRAQVQKQAPKCLNF